MASSSSTDTYNSPPPTPLSQVFGSQCPPPTNAASVTPLNAAPLANPHPLTTTAHQFPTPTRQLRPPKSPLYRPAVLRPTERPWRQSPNSPPPGSSVGSLSSTYSDDDRSLARVSTSDSAKTWGLGKVTEVEWYCDEGSGEVTGLPTRAHWQPDASARSCNSASCAKSFSLFERRHHCRRCGNIFCNTHASAAVPLDQHATFHAQGTLSRACDACWLAFQRWDVAHRSRSNSGSSGDSSGLVTPRTPTMGIAGVGVGVGGGGKGGFVGMGGDGVKVGSVSGSVPRDWNWSTF
ncbi:hypothetical protein FGG08_005894 [Glutinoglossum americanum]|uniref:FYVE-type domain-containing protein n=1 Tax=Glutinoglossum americanum TaxID=1670608 RepID=A0A9P8HZH2_9PEZI|nr:hypothetical protein FGG08_005894 [Glutinoglossum americanum]